MKQLVSLLVLAIWLTPSAASAQFKLTLADPKGDDKGPGAYVYPTAAEYKPGSFDLTSVEIEEKGDQVVFTVTLKARIEDAWDSTSWTPPGQGFSLQFVQIYVDTDHMDGSGHKEALPCMNVTFPEASRWEKVVLVSPQAITRTKTEVKTKAKDLKDDVIVPRQVKVSGKKLIVSVPKSVLGTPTMDWGWQVLVQSNEGYPRGDCLLTRDVNEVEGEHRFGGGDDWGCDPHAIDLIVPPARGGDGEKDGQFKALAYTCAGSDRSKATLAVVPMVYPGK
ncbi:MAG: glucodextranase DOMON-like domain-containing protein [Pseudomonadota bacterium]